tara:strand:- start:643 stop:1047 length:405 start_codon:yes stop_codon:yes gene_type:complete
MNKLLLVPILVMSGCGYANAASTMDHFKEVIYKKPYSVEVCSDVSTSGDKTGDAIKGAIIGGLLGNNIKGEEHGGAAGAVIGAMLGHANSNATGGSKTVCKVETRYNEERQTIYSHSTVTFTHEGKEYTVRFQK